MTITLRLATAADAEPIRALIQRVQINPFGLQWQRFTIAEEDGRFVGCVQVKPHWDGMRELASLAVLPAAQGHGVGAMLIRAVLAQEKPGLHLMCRSELEPFYQRFGFVRLEPPARPYSLRFLPWLGTLLMRWQGGEGISVMRHVSG